MLTTLYDNLCNGGPFVVCKPGKYRCSHVADPKDKNEIRNVVIFQRLVSFMTNPVPLTCLDVGTSGVMLMCDKGREDVLRNAIVHRHNYYKEYIAYVYAPGYFAKEGATPAGVEFSNGKRRAKVMGYLHTIDGFSTHEMWPSRPSDSLCTTYFTVLESFTLHISGKTVPVLKVRAVTYRGGRHQVRVHALNAFGFQLVGDTTYGAHSGAHNGREPLNRPALHGSLLAFNDPNRSGTGKCVVCRAPLPEDLLSLESENLRKDIGTQDAIDNLCNIEKQGAPFLRWAPTCPHYLLLKLLRHDTTAFNLRDESVAVIFAVATCVGILSCSRSPYVLALLLDAWDEKVANIGEDINDDPLRFAHVKLTEIIPDMDLLNFYELESEYEREMTRFKQREDKMLKMVKNLQKEKDALVEVVEDLYCENCKRREQIQGYKRRLVQAEEQIEGKNKVQKIQSHRGAYVAQALMETDPPRVKPSRRPDDYESLMARFSLLQKYQPQKMMGELAE